MSWLPNPFKSNQPPDGEDSADADDSADDVAGGGSVKDDLSVIGESIGRQFRGVAAFLAPPPSPRASVPVADDASGDSRSPRLAGVRNDLAEISGSFKSSLSLLSSNKTVIEISKLASNLLQLNDEKVEENHSVGITEEVVDFVTEISQRPESWTDFRLPNDNAFDMSEAQAKHISVIQQLVPTLADLKAKLSGDLSERQFWMIYFILLLPQLDENSLNTLSTPEIVKARSTLLTVGSSSQSDSKFVAESSEDVNTESIDEQRQLHNEDQISFSDVEDDDSDVSTRQYSSVRGKGQDSGTVASSPDGSNDWVRLDKSSDDVRRGSREGQPSSQGRDSESEDWLTIDDFDDYNEAST